MFMQPTHVESLGITRYFSVALQLMTLKEAAEFWSMKQPDRQVVNLM